MPHNRKIIFERTDSYNPFWRYTWHIIIYSDSIEAAFYLTDKTGYIIPNSDKIQLVSNDHINQINPYRFGYWGKFSKYPTGFRLTTDDYKICIINNGFRSRSYKQILNALQESFQTRWTRINGPLLPDCSLGRIDNQ